MIEDLSTVDVRKLKLRNRETRDLEYGQVWHEAKIFEYTPITTRYAEATAAAINY